MVVMALRTSRNRMVATILHFSRFQNDHYLNILNFGSRLMKMMNLLVGLLFVSNPIDLGWKRALKRRQ